MKPTRKKSQAEWSRIFSPYDPRCPQPLRTDELGRAIFADGSHLSFNAAGQAIFGNYDLGEWHAQEIFAENLGRADRLGRRKMRPEFLARSARYPKRIRDYYRKGFRGPATW